MSDGPGSGVRVTGSAVPRGDEVLTPGALAFVAELQRRFGDRRDELLRRRRTRRDEIARGQRLDFLAETHEVREGGWTVAPAPADLVDRRVAALVDFGRYFFHNAAELLARGSGPYFYLPKTESHLEARLWNEVFTFAEQRLDVPLGSIRATVRIETVLAGFEMDEILFELRDHASGLNAGRWDYLFSVVKTFRDSGSDFILPDRSAVTMTAPMMRAYTDLLVSTCHHRQAFAMGGMAAFIPSRRDPKINEQALAKVREDKEREAADGFDGSWVAHPDLVPVCEEVFDKRLGGRPDQLDHQRPDVKVTAAQLLDVSSVAGERTEAGLRSNVDVGLRYLEAWLRGNGAVGIHNLMEDAATAEISRSQVWQWLHNQVRLDTGETVTAELVRRVVDEELSAIRAEVGEEAYRSSRFDDARTLFERVALDEDFPEFLTLSASELID